MDENFKRYIAALIRVAKIAEQVYEHDDFVCEPSEESRARDRQLGEALAELKAAK